MKILSVALKTVVFVFAGLLSAALLVICVAIGLFFYFDAQLPGADNMAQIQLSQPLRIYTADGQLMRRYGIKTRLPVTYEQVPQVLVDAFVAAEDDRFFQHPGVDYQGILRAAVNLVMTGTKSQGGSTITMQLARNLYLSPKRTYVRKIKEIILALKLESELSKQQILTLYMNDIYLGSGAYGVGAAAKIYYAETVDELTLAQAAMLAGLPKAPSAYSPRSYPQQARRRRGYVLARMLKTNKIDQAAYDKAVEQPVETVARSARPRFTAGDYVAEMARQQMIKRYGDQAYTKGFRVYTTVNSERQRAALKAVRDDLLAYDARHKWRGSQATLSDAVLDDHEQLMQALAQEHADGLVPAVVMAVSGDAMTLMTHDHGEVSIDGNDNPWLRKGGSASKLVERGDQVWLIADDGTNSPWELAQLPQAQAALVALDPHDGSIQALVGGFDFSRSKFNRAMEAYRQTGSSIKPFIYAAALANGFTAASLINDAPVVYGGRSPDAWRPENYGHRIHGPTRLREGLVHSRNLMTIRLLRSVGISTAIDYLARFGLPRDRMPHDLTLSLGTAAFTPMQMATGYAVMANGGYRVTPYLIDRIESADGKVLFQAEPKVACQKAGACAQIPDAQQLGSRPLVNDAHWAPRVITADNAYVISDIMRDVINRGTGGAARVLGRSDLSGKTGTTDDTTDAWFVGFNARLATVTWVGYDSPKSLGRGETGAHAALPMWIEFMRAALKGVPKSIMPRPDNIVTVKIDPHSGQLALNGGGMEEIFPRDEAPTAEQARTYRGFDPGEPAPGRIF